MILVDERYIVAQPTTGTAWFDNAKFGQAQQLPWALQVGDVIEAHIEGVSFNVASAAANDAGFLRIMYDPTGSFTDQVPLIQLISRFQDHGGSNIPVRRLIRDISPLSFQVDATAGDVFEIFATIKLWRAPDCGCTGGA